MFGKPWTRAAGQLRPKKAAYQGVASLSARIWAVVFSLVLAMSSPLGMLGSASLAWAEQADLAQVAADPQAGAQQTGDPQADDTGSLDPPQAEQAAQDALDAQGTDDATPPTSEDAQAQAQPEATVALEASDEGWALVTLAGCEEGDTLVVDAMGRPDAIWTGMLKQALPDATVEQVDDNEVEIGLAGVTDGQWELPGVMCDLVATAALLDGNGEARAFAEGPALYGANLTVASGETFTAYNEHIVDGNCPKIRNAQTGQAAWCADSRRAAPGTNTETGDWPEATFTEASAWDTTTISGVNLGSVLAQLEYIMAHADATSDEGIYITQQAIWTLTNPDRIPYGSYSHYNQQICALVDAANAYAASGVGYYSGACRVFVPTTGNGYYDRWMQYLVVSAWNPLSNLTVSKESAYDAATGAWTGLPKQVTWRLVSTDGTTEGTAYDRTATSEADCTTVRFDDTPRETRYRLYELQAPDGYQARETIGLYCNPDGSWSVWNAEAGEWNEATWSTAQGGTTVYTGLTGAAGSTVLHVQDAPNAGAIELFKTSSEPAVTDGNDCYSLEGARYGVYSDEGLTQLVETLETDATGHAVSGALDEGAYWVRETEASTGYALDETTYRVEVKTGQTARVNEENGGTVSEEPQGDPQAIVVRKVDALSGQGVPQGDMSLAGAQITVKYYKGFLNEDDLAKDGAPQPERTWVLQTDEDGVAALIEKCKVGGDEFYTLGGRPYLPLGTTVVRESKAPEGYELNPQVYVCHFTPDESGRKWISFDMTATIPQTQERGGLAIRKVDAESASQTPKGAASLDGARFEIYNASEHAVTVDGVVFEPETLEAVQAGEAQAIRTIVAHDGVATTDEDGDGLDESLPFGTYYVREVSPGTGYLLDGQVRTVAVHEAGKVARCDAACANQVARADLAFDKVYEDTKAGMPGVAFLVESRSTGERHVVVADGTGHVDTSAGAHPHTERTNANDAAYDPATGTVDESLLDAQAGVWFYGDAEGTGEVNDTMGALPFDTYTVSELATSASAGTWLRSFEVAVTENGNVVDAGTVEDVWVPTLRTELLSRDGTHDAYATADERLTDTATYGHFRADTYTAVLELCDEDGNVLHDSQGRELRASAQLELSGDGTYELGIDCDLSGMAGMRVVARHLVYDAAGELYASHDDMASTAQSVDVSEAPKVSTTLVEAESGLHMAAATGSVKLTDTVGYSGLKPGQTYTLSGTLMDKETSSQVVGPDGKPVSASVEFTPSNASGTQEVVFEFDASALAGRTLVAFETLSCQGRELAVHADIDDGQQAVVVPNVSTVLTSAEGGHTVMGESAIDLTDTVEYANVLPGATYRLVGTLHDPKTGDAYKDAAGNPFEASAEFEATDVSGQAKVTFKGVSGIRAGQAVAFEELYVRTSQSEGDAAWVLVGAHKDAADAQQTVSFNTPNLATTLTDKATGLHETSLAEQTTLVDTVEYEGLETGKTYRIEGRLVDKQTGKTVRDAKGKALTASGEFKAATAKGRVEVTFTFDATKLAGKQVVAFETVSFNGREVAVHANLGDAAQTVSFVDVRTTATDPEDGDHEAVAKAGMQLVDRVEMRGLEAGKAYTLVTELVVADSHETVIASSTRFVPTKSDTSLDVTASFDGSNLAGKDLVFLETLQRDGKTVAQHRDYSDAGQTVSLVTPPPATPGDDLPQTGQGLMWAVFVGMGALCAFVGVMLVRGARGPKPNVPQTTSGETAPQPMETVDAAGATYGQDAVPRIRPRKTGRSGMRPRRNG